LSTNPIALEPTENEGRQAVIVTGLDIPMGRQRMHLDLLALNTTLNSAA
jgi:hypothetical protein